MAVIYNTKTFTEIYDDLGTFKYYYNNSGFPQVITDDNMGILYYLLYSRFGNNPIANLDENQFRYKVCAIIWQYGPTWQKRLDIQKKLRELTENDMERVHIYNHALNPSTEPSMDSKEILPMISEQRTQRSTSKINEYVELWNALSVDVTEYFLDKFTKLFKSFVGYGRPRLYRDEEDEVNEG